MAKHRCPIAGFERIPVNHLQVGDEIAINGGVGWFVDVITLQPSAAARYLVTVRTRPNGNTRAASHNQPYAVNALIDRRIAKRY